MSEALGCRRLPVPKEVSDLIGSALTEESLNFWWTSRITALGGLTPEFLWRVGAGKQVLELIKSVQNGNVV